MNWLEAQFQKIVDFLGKMFNKWWVWMIAVVATPMQWCLDFVNGTLDSIHNTLSGYISQFTGLGSITGYWSQLSGVLGFCNNFVSMPLLVSCVSLTCTVAIFTGIVRIVKACIPTVLS